MVGPSAGPAAALHQQEQRRAARRADPSQRPVRQEEELAACARPRVLAVRLDLGQKGRRCNSKSHGHVSCMGQSRDCLLKKVRFRLDAALPAHNPVPSRCAWSLTGIDARQEMHKLVYYMKEQ